MVVTKAAVSKQGEVVQSKKTAPTKEVKEKLSVKREEKKPADAKAMVGKDKSPKGTSFTEAAKETKKKATKKKEEK
jgi:hypothetical protein